MIVGTLVRQQKLLFNERGEKTCIADTRKIETKKKRASLASDRPCGMYRKMAPSQAVASKQPRHFWVVGIGRVRGIETWELDQSQRDRKAGNCTNGHTTVPTCFSGQRGDIIVFCRLR